MSSAVAMEMLQLEVKGSDPQLSLHALLAPWKESENLPVWVPCTEWQMHKGNMPHILRKIMKILYMYVFSHRTITFSPFFNDFLEMVQCKGSRMFLNWMLKSVENPTLLKSQILNGKVYLFKDNCNGLWLHFQLFHIFLYARKNDKYLNRQKIGLFKEMGKIGKFFLKSQISLRVKISLSIFQVFKLNPLSSQILIYNKQTFIYKNVNIQHMLYYAGNIGKYSTYI